MKKLFPIFIALLVFVGALLFLQPEKTIALVVATRELPAGRTLTAEDLTFKNYPLQEAPEGAYTATEALMGETLRTPRFAGDLLYPAHLGGEALPLAPNERALAIKITDAGGLAGLLKPGDVVGLTAVLFGGGNTGAYAKAIPGSFRVMYLSPEFAVQEPVLATDAEGAGGAFGSAGNTPRREDSGTVILAFPTTATVLAYDFAAFGVDSPTRTLYLLDLLPALDHANNVALSLFLTPEKAEQFLTSGVYLPDLMLTPGPSPTPTETPVGYEVELTPSPTP